jgi:hypothetical protein
MPFLGGLSKPIGTGKVIASLLDFLLLPQVVAPTADGISAFAAAILPPLLDGFELLARSPGSTLATFVAAKLH